LFNYYQIKHVNINILLQKKLVVISLQPEAGVAVGMIVSVQAVVNVAQRTKDVVVHQVDSVRVGIPVIVPLIVDVELVVENPKNHRQIMEVPSAITF
jgi:hypothetical protein